MTWQQIVGGLVWSGSEIGEVEVFAQIIFWDVASHAPIRVILVYFANIETENKVAFGVDEANVADLSWYGIVWTFWNPKRVPMTQLRQLAGVDDGGVHGFRHW